MIINPDQAKTYVSHTNGNGYDNRTDNLCWVTQATSRSIAGKLGVAKRNGTYIQISASEFTLEGDFITNHANIDDNKEIINACRCENINAKSIFLFTSVFIDDSYKIKGINPITLKVR